MKDLDKNIKKEAPILFGIKKETYSLKVPDKYFDELTQELMQITKANKSKIISMHQWMLYSSTVAALFILVFSSLQEVNQQKNVESINKSFNNLTVNSFENELFPLDDLSVAIDFNDESELDFIMKELEKPSKKLSLYSDNFDDFFESEIEDIY